MPVNYNQKLDFLEGYTIMPTTDALAHYERDDSWPVRDTGFSAYCDRVELANGRSFWDIVREHVGHSDDNVAIDIAGGSGQALRELMLAGVIGTGIVTNHQDKRTDYERAHDELTHVAGDLRIKETWHDILDISETLAPRGLALVLCQPIGALQREQPSFYEGFAHTCIDMLADGKVAALQVPGGIKASSKAGERQRILKNITDRQDVREVMLPEDIYTISANMVLVKE